MIAEDVELDVEPDEIDEERQLTGGILENCIAIIWLCKIYLIVC